MLSTERQRIIMEQSLLHGEVSIPALAKQFNVSVETIRRDINLLAEKNLLIKVHGGAVATRPPVKEDAYDIRASRNVAAKTKIAEYFAEHIIKDNDRVVMSSGSTMEFIARKINAKNILVVTNSITVATVLQEKAAKGEISGEIILLGGYVSANERYVSGIITLEMLKKFTFTKAILGCSAINEQCLMTSNIDEGIIMEQMIERSTQSFVAADSEKFGITSSYTYASKDAVTKIITENGEV